MERFNQIDNKVSYSERPKYLEEVAKILRERGYETADRDRMLTNKIEEYESDVIGIALPKEPKIYNILITKIKVPQRGPYIGRLWFNSSSLGAKENEKWVLEVFGRGNAPRLSELMKDLSQRYDVKVDMDLVSEDAPNSLFPSDTVY